MYSFNYYSSKLNWVHGLEIWCSLFLIHKTNFTSLIEHKIYTQLRYWRIICVPYNIVIACFKVCYYNLKIVEQVLEIWEPKCIQYPTENQSNYCPFCLLLYTLSSTSLNTNISFVVSFTVLKKRIKNIFLKGNNNTSHCCIRKMNNVMSKNIHSVSFIYLFFNVLFFLFLSGYMFVFIIINRTPFFLQQYYQGW